MKYLLSINFRTGDIDRMNQLAEQAQAGTLSEKDIAELESYRRVGHLLALMQSKARISLNDPGHRSR